MAGPKTEAALAALQTGGDISNIEVDAVVETEVEVSDEAEQVTDPAPEPEGEEAIQSESQDEVTSEDVSETEEDGEPGSVEEIVVNGKRVKLDYANREQIKKYAKQAGGFRKMQAERDDLINWRKEIEPELKELKQFEQTIEGAYSDDGIAGLARLLAGSETAYNEWLDAEVQKELKKQNATPAELERIELQEQLEKERKEREKLRRQAEKEREEREQFKEQKELTQLQTKMDRGFNKWRFAGKLGDAELEESIDSMVWEKAKAEIAEIPDEVELTAALVDKAFRKAANSFRKFSKQEGRKVASKSIENSKKVAATKAVAMASKGVSQSQDSDEVRNRIKSGDIRGSFYSFLDKLK